MKTMKEYEDEYNRLEDEIAKEVKKNAIPWQLSPESQKRVDTLRKEQLANIEEMNAMNSERFNALLNK